MARKHYIRLCYLDGSCVYFISFVNDVDGVVLDDDGTMPSFPAQAELRRYARGHGLTLETESPFECDLDSVQGWLANPEGTSIDCDLILNAWNLFDEIAVSTSHADFERCSRNAALSYDKMFWGCNLPAVTPPGEDYIPLWSPTELAENRQILSGGLHLFRAVVKANSQDQSQ